MSVTARPRPAPLLWILLPFAAGLVLRRYAGFEFTAPIAATATAAILGSALLAKKNPWPWGILLVASLVAIGGGRMQSKLPPPAVTNTPAPREAELTLQVESLYNLRDPQRAAGLARIVNTPPHLARYRDGTVYFSLDLEEKRPSPLPGEQLSCIGLLEPLPPRPPPQSFDSYLAGNLVQYTYKRGSILETVQAAPAWRRWSEASRHALASVLSDNKRPESSLSGALVALLTGQKSHLSEEQRELFLDNGSMHLFAVSGLHIGVIAVCIHSLLLLIRVPRRLLPLLNLGCILAFVITTGGAASSWRAFLMIASLYLAQGSKRQTSPLNALILSAIVYLWIHPEELFQAGFQMSYAAVAAILLLGVPLGRRANGSIRLYPHLPFKAQTRWQRALSFTLRWALNGFAVSLAAFLVSSLLGILYFGLLPCYGILANLIAMPLATGAIIAGFCALATAWIPFLPLAYLFNNAALLIIALVQWLLEQLRHLPHATLESASPSSAAVWCGLAAILASSALAYAKGPKASLGWTALPIVLTPAFLYWAL